MLIDLTATRHADELRQTWQGRLLAHTATSTGRVPSSELQAVVLSIIAHCYDDTDALPVLLRVLFPVTCGFVTAPFISSIAHVDKAGRIVANVTYEARPAVRRTVLFPSLHAMQSALRNIADLAKLNDDERVLFFACARRWCPADYRRDPTMDPRDPDATRFRYH